MGADVWLVYMIEQDTPIAGRQQWFFWRADLDGGVWVSDEKRATTYPTRMQAGNAADDVADREENEGVNVKVIRVADLA